MSDVANRHTLAQPIARRFRIAGSSEEREETLTEIAVRPMLVGDLRAIAKVQGETEQGLALLQRLTGLEPAQLDKMGMADFAAISGIVEGFLPPGFREDTKKISA